MTCAISHSGKPLHFPHALLPNDQGVLMPAPSERLAEIAAEVRDDDLLLFSRRLIDGARKRRREPRYALLSRQRLELAVMVLQRALEAA